MVMTPNKLNEENCFNIEKYKKVKSPFYKSIQGAWTKNNSLGSDRFETEHYQKFFDSFSSKII